MDSWALNSKFQLVSSQISGGAYLYVFSLDPKGSINVHWPRDEYLDHQFIGRHESALITDSNIELVIPGPLKTIRATQPGLQHLCILISFYPIKKFNSILKKFGASNGEIPDRLQSALGSIAKNMEPDYNKNKMELPVIIMFFIPKYKSFYGIFPYSS